MGYSQENGYVPVDIQTIMDSLMANVNTQFSKSFTRETFQGTNFYKHFYALAQRMQESEVKTSEIFVKLQQYFDEINARIQRPVVTNPGTIENLEKEGYITSVKPMVEEDAGKRNVCVDVDDTDEDYADKKLEICTLLSKSTVGGVVTEGTEEETIVLSNGQSFVYKYHLPNRIPIWLRLTITLSENNQVVIGAPDATKLKLLQNINARYRLGLNFEPQKYFSLADAPWGGQVVLEWTDDVTDGELDETPTWHDEIFDASFDDRFDIALERITLVEE